MAMMEWSGVSAFTGSPVFFLRDMMSYDHDSNGTHNKGGMLGDKCIDREFLSKSLTAWHGLLLWVSHHCVYSNKA